MMETPVPTPVSPVPVAPRPVTGPVAIKPAPPRSLTSLKQLPRGGRPLDPVGKPLEMNEAVREEIAVWLLPSEGSQLGGGGAPVTTRRTPSVWLILEESKARGMMSYQYRQTIKEKGYKIEHTASTSKELLAAIHEQREGTDSADSGVAQDNDLIRFFEDMVATALQERVSDIHIEKKMRGAVIRMRKHGQLKVWKEISAAYASSLATVIHNVLAENKDITFMPDDYQSASINTRVAGVDVKLRYQSLPTYGDGFDVIMRVLPMGTDDEKMVDLSELGYEKSQVQQLLEIVARPVGAMVIAGTTGSGKSTTLKNLLMFVNASRGYRCKIYTIEDPPEYRIPKTSQIPVVRRKGEEGKEEVSPFLAPLVATMRADPDLLMIGEIRDKFTGDGMKKANQSGHQVMTTIHASSALGSLPRLVDFGIQPNVLGSPEFINGLIYQKLLPTLCPACSVLLSDRLSGTEAPVEVLELAKRLKKGVGEAYLEHVRLHGPGCEKCDKMGVNGRTVCSEIIVPDFTMLKHFRQGHDIEAYKYWRSMSDRNMGSDNMVGKTVLEHALMKVCTGQVSPEDVEELLGPVDSANRLLDQLTESDGKDAASAKAKRAAEKAELDEH